MANNNPEDVRAPEARRKWTFNKSLNRIADDSLDEGYPVWFRIVDQVRSKQQP
jgi:hypothetical protein